VHPSDVKDPIRSTLLQPPCPKCKPTTMLERITPGSAGFDIRTFECAACDDVHQCVVALVEMKLRETAGRFRGSISRRRWRTSSIATVRQPDAITTAVKRGVLAGQIELCASYCLWTGAKNFCGGWQDTRN
jgi:hypothetical protein